MSTELILSNFNICTTLLKYINLKCISSVQAEPVEVPHYFSVAFLYVHRTNFLHYVLSFLNRCIYSSIDSFVYFTAYYKKFETEFYDYIRFLCVNENKEVVKKPSKLGKLLPERDYDTTLRSGTCYRISVCRLYVCL